MRELDWGTLRKYHTAASFAIDLFKKGYQIKIVREKISKKFNDLDAEQIIEIARCRLKAREKFKFWDKLLMDKEGLRYSSPDLVADYIAKRLSTDVIADLGCGIGAQAAFFGRYSTKVIAVEKNPIRASYARWNLHQYGIEFELIFGDALNEEVIRKVSKETAIIFSDPSRPSWELRREFSSMTPNPLEVIRGYKRFWAHEEFAFQIPPQLPPERIPLEGEKEYLSVNGKLNRLTVYMGDLMEHEKSVVALPGEHRLTPLEGGEKVEETDKPQNYIYIVNTAVLKAQMLTDLVAALGEDMKIYYKSKRRTLLTSNAQILSPFFESSYEIITEVTLNPAKINSELKKLKAGKATLRISISPSEYWEFRKKIERDLHGDEHFYILEGRNGKAIIAKRLSTKSPLTSLI